MYKNSRNLNFWPLYINVRTVRALTKMQIFGNVFRSTFRSLLGLGVMTNLHKICVMIISNMVSGCGSCPPSCWNIWWEWMWSRAHGGNLSFWDDIHVAEIWCPFQHSAWNIYTLEQSVKSACMVQYIWWLN